MTSPIPRMMQQISITPIAVANGPQIGARTHHHDHEIILHSLSVMKIKPRIAKNGKLLDVDF